MYGSENILGLMRFCTGRRETEQRDNQSYAKLERVQNGSQSTLNQLQAEPLPIGAHFAVLKIKPCKRNNHQNSDHTKDAAKEGNAEEQPDAGCGIKR